jgi:hypothetical protein
MTGNNLHAGDWKDDKRGRPLVKDKKIKVPRVVVKQGTLKMIEKIADEQGVSRSELFQRALDSLVLMTYGQKF